MRFAPSPTGFLHVGNARAALYNWLFARQSGGTFVLRIEDTDAERHNEDAVEVIRSTMRWLGLDWDEEVRQGARNERHVEVAEQLLAAGEGYWCACTRDEIDARTKGNPTSGYDRHCRDLGLSRTASTALRFRVPRDGTTTVTDVVRGDPTFENRTIEDFVLLRSNGTATFVLANMVDDLDMAITHVIRGEDHLPNTPKQLLMWRALDAGDPPVYAHLPMLVNEQRKKLSKRRDPVFVERYAAEGYMAEPFVNYLALLGWAPDGDREVLTRDELVAEFRLEDVKSSPAFFDVKKLRHFNQQYIQALSDADFVTAVDPWLAPSWDRAVVREMAPLLKTRVEVLGDVPAMIHFLFCDVRPDAASWDKAVAGNPSAAAILDAVAGGLDDCPWAVEDVKAVVERVADQVGLKLGKAQAPVRVAVTGRTVGPPLFESIVVLGRDRTVARVRTARQRLG